MSDVDEWWDCPECGGPTYVREGEYVPEKVPAGRECYECEWSVTIPEADAR